MGAICRPQARLGAQWKLFCFFSFFLCFDFVPLVGNPRECRGYVAFPPIFGPREGRGEAANSDFVPLLGTLRMQGLCRISAHLWAPEKAGVRQPILILSILLGTTLGGAMPLNTSTTYHAPPSPPLLQIFFCQHTSSPSAGPRPPLPEIGWKVAGSRRMARCYAPPRGQPPGQVPPNFYCGGRLPVLRMVICGVWQTGNPIHIFLRSQPMQTALQLP